MGKHITLASLLAMSALLTACGGGAESESSETASAPAAQAPAAAPAAPAAAPAAPAAPAPAAGPPAATDVATLDGVQFASLTGNAAAGRAVFAQCRTCHVTDPGVNRIGPSLAGIVGRAAGIVPGFTYSAANSGSGITWTPDKLFQYLENPQRVVPGTRMIFTGIPDAQRRADLIAYLQNPS
jgi:cytochrome c